MCPFAHALCHLFTGLMQIDERLFAGLSPTTQFKCYQYVPVFAEFLIHLRTLWVNGIEIEARFIEDAVTIFGPLLNELSASARMPECHVAGVDLLALYATAGHLLRPDDVPIDRMFAGDGDVAAFATRWQNGVGAAVVMMCRQTRRRPIVRQNDGDLAKVRSTMQRRVQFIRCILHGNLSMMKEISKKKTHKLHLIKEYIRREDTKNKNHRWSQRMTTDICCV